MRQKKYSSLSSKKLLEIIKFIKKQSIGSKINIILERPKKLKTYEKNELVESNRPENSSISSLERRECQLSYMREKLSLIWKNDKYDYLAIGNITVAKDLKKFNKKKWSRDAISKINQQELPFYMSQELFTRLSDSIKWVCLKQYAQRGWKAKYEGRVSKDLFCARYHVMLLLEKAAFIKGLTKKQTDRLGQLNISIKDRYAFMLTGTNGILAKAEDTRILALKLNTWVLGWVALAWAWPTWLEKQEGINKLK